MNIVFPWPPKELSPNARVHWAKKSRAAKSYRKACWGLALKQKAKAPAEGPIYVHMVFQPPVKRNRDQDNLVASMKSGLDGLADALGANDSRFVINSSISDLLKGQVVVSVEWA